MKTFRPLVKKQMHTFNVEGTIMGPQEAVHIIYSFIKNGVLQAGIHQLAMLGHYGYVCQSNVLVEEHLPCQWKPR